MVYLLRQALRSRMSHLRAQLVCVKVRAVLCSSVCYPDLEPSWGAEFPRVFVVGYRLVVQRCAGSRMVGEDLAHLLLKRQSREDSTSEVPYLLCIVKRKVTNTARAKNA